VAPTAHSGTHAWERSRDARSMQMPDISRRRALTYAACVLAVVALAGRVLAPSASEGPKPAPVASQLEVEPDAPAEVVVHVAGAVARPGLYRLKDGSRVDDAIREAGGATPRAALGAVNLAAPVADGQQILVPAGGGVATSEPAGVGADGAATAAGGRVHLNSATIEQLDALPGVGPVTAQNILDYRAENGAFGSVEELDAVPGIGPARLEQLKELVDL